MHMLYIVCTTEELIHYLDTNVNKKSACLSQFLNLEGQLDVVEITLICFSKSYCICVD